MLIYLYDDVALSTCCSIVEAGWNQSARVMVPPEDIGPPPPTAEATIRWHVGYLSAPCRDSYHHLSTRFRFCGTNPIRSHTISKTTNFHCTRLNVHNKSFRLVCARRREDQPYSSILQLCTKNFCSRAKLPRKRSQLCCVKDSYKMD